MATPIAEPRKRGRPRKEPNTPARVQRPKGRPPPTGAVLTDGVWALPDEAIEIVAERIIRHRAICRLRYRATVQGIRKARPHLLRKKNDELQRTLDGYARNATDPKCLMGRAGRDIRDRLLESTRIKGHPRKSQGRSGIHLL